MDTVNFNPPETEARPQSKVGIASFVISLLGTFLFCLGLAIVAFTFFSGPRTPSSSDRLFNFIYFLTGGSAVLALIGMLAGVISLFQTRFKKTFGTIGLVLGILILAALCCGVMIVMFVPK